MITDALAWIAAHPMDLLGIIVLVVAALYAVGTLVGLAFSVWADVEAEKRERLDKIQQACGDGRPRAAGYPSMSIAPHTHVASSLMGTMPTP